MRPWFLILYRPASARLFCCCLSLFFVKLAALALRPFNPLIRLKPMVAGFLPLSGSAAVLAGHLLNNRKCSFIKVLLVA